MQTRFSHTLLKKDTASLRRVATKYAKQLRSSIDAGLYNVPESALAVASDTEYQDALAHAVAPFGTPKHVVLVGIGGSSLGTQAVYEALKTPQSPTLLVLDALDDDMHDTVTRLLSSAQKPEDVALIIVSKSGSTTETVVQADAVCALFAKHFGDAYRSRVLVVTDASSALAAFAEEHSYLVCTIPPIIGGRYSVFTAVGIVPLMLLGIDTVALRKGAASAVSAEGIQLAIERMLPLAHAAEQGVRTVNFFTFPPRLERVGHWYRQLLAESIGKSRTRAGKRFSRQLLPTVSTSIDLHSVAQLYLGGYKGVYTRFIDVHTGHTDALDGPWVAALLPDVAQKQRAGVRHAIATGVMSAYDDAGLLYDATTLTSCTAYDIGHLLATYMVEVMLLCNAFDVSAFDQPEVELYKKHVRTALTP